MEGDFGGGSLEGTRGGGWPTARSLPGAARARGTAKGPFDRAGIALA